MKILRFTAENIKKLKTVEIKPDGSLVQIAGPNGSGKSSVLDAIFMALAGSRAIPSKPVRTGAKKGSVTLDLGDYIVTRRFTEAGGTTLTVEAQSGARFPSPQAMLDKMLGALTFDPLAFSRMDPKKQLEQLRGLVKLDVDIDALDRANKTDFESRAEINRDAKSFETQADAITIDPTAPSEPIDTAALLQTMQEAGETNAELERRRSRREQAQRDIESHEARAKEIAVEIDRLQALHRESLATAGDLRTRLEAAEPLPDPIDVTAVRASIDAATATNAAVASNKRCKDLRERAGKEQDKSDALTAAMEERTKQRQAAIASAVMPVPGLSFGDGEVLYNDLPLDQASGAEQLRVSMAIAMAANPELRVLRIKDGSLLDENSLRIVESMATEADYQVWLETVDTSGKVGIVMEDGSVRDAEAKAA